MIDPEAIRDAVLRTDGVIAMHAGPFGTAATFGPSGRVWGVRSTDYRLDVHIVAEQTQHLASLGRAVRAAVTRASNGYDGIVTVHIEDISLPGSLGASQTGTGATPVRDEAHQRRTP